MNYEIVENRSTNAVFDKINSFHLPIFIPIVDYTWMVENNNLCNSIYLVKLSDVITS